MAQTTKMEMKKTGGGPAPTPLSDLESKVICLIPACQIDGIPGGTESGLCSNETYFDNVDTQDLDASMSSEMESSRSITALPTEDTQKAANKRSHSTTLTKSKSPQLQTVVDLEREKLEVLQKIQQDGSDRLEIERK